MRSFVRHGLVLGSCLVAMVASSGCQAKKATEYVNGMSTQMSVPRDIKGIRIQISSNGFVNFSQTYTAYNGIVQLPKSLGNYPGSDDAQGKSIRFEIIAIGEDFKQAATDVPTFVDPDLQYVSPTDPSSSGIRIMRSSTQPYIADRIMYLPMALNYSCYNTLCDAGKTCKGGTCVDEVMTPEDAAKLPDYVDGMGDGTDGGCFSVGTCMGAAVPAIPVNEDTCDFSLAETKDAPTGNTDPFRTACAADSDCSVGRKCTSGLCDFLPPGSPAWTGLNVQISYDGGHTNEILNLDPVEGFTIPDATKPQNFRLAPGLCAMLHGQDTGGKATNHLLTGVLASGVCGPKVATQSICLADQLKLMGANPDGTGKDAGICTLTRLTPSRAALAVVVDESTNNKDFFDASKIAEFQAPLNDPSFGQTDFALFYAHGTDSCGVAPTFPLEGQGKATADFKASLTSIATNLPVLANGDPNLAGAMSAAYSYLEGGAGGSYLRKAVLVISKANPEPGPWYWNTTTCSATPATLASTAFGKGILTFPLQLTGAQDAAAAQDSSLSLIYQNGTATPAPEPIDKFMPTTAQKPGAFSQLIDQLATCAYDVDTANLPAAADLPGAVVAYNNPITNVRSADIGYNIACNSDVQTRDLNAPSSWGMGNGAPAGQTRIFVCGQACKDYQSVLAQAAAFSLDYNQAPLASPMYLRSIGCNQK